MSTRHRRPGPGSSAPAPSGAANGTARGATSGAATGAARSATTGAASGAAWRVLLEARWLARLQEVTELSLAYHEAAAADGPATAGGPGGAGQNAARPGARNRRRLLAQAVAARRALAETDDALARLAAGRYGRCEDCAAAIPAQLLVAAPETRYCPSCQLAPRGRRGKTAANRITAARPIAAGA